MTKQLVLIGWASWQDRAQAYADGASDFLDDESGQDLIEYGLVATLLSLSAIASLNALCVRVVNLVVSVNTGLGGVI
jgi:pilus assembly protein Flp/PilA